MVDVLELLDRFFLVSARGSTLGTELRAGLTTFFTMGYILVVNPTVLSDAGLPFSAVAFATAATAIIGSGFVGVFGNLPFGLAPGMGLNAYFAYGVCLARGIPVGVALAIMILVGVTFTVLSAIGACSLLQNIMPNNLKHATTVAIGIFQAFIGFRMIDLVVADEHTLVALGDIYSVPVALSLATTFLIGVLVALRVQGAMLLGIGASSCASWALGLHALPTTFMEVPSVHSFWDQIQWVECAERWEETVPIALAILFVCIFDTSGVQFGAGMQAGLLDDKGQLPGTKAAFLGASFATTVGGVLGTSPVIIHNETCAGIAEGGRTGLTALVVAVMFALSVFFVPIFAAVPITATAPALIIVGAFMMGPAGAMNWDDFKESLPAFLTITVMPLTYSIANGVVAGLFSYLVLALFTGERRLPQSTVGGGGGGGGLSEPLKGGAPKRPGESPAGSSAAESPHAVVRDVRLAHKNSFNGLSSLATKASPSSTPSPQQFGSNASAARVRSSYEAPYMQP